MKKQLLISSAALAAMLALLQARPASADEKMFVAQKCNKCHAISALGITKAGGEEEEAEEAGAKAPPDLSGVGKTLDAAALTGYLKKETTGKDGKKHKIKFKGSDEELAQMVSWLVTLKGEPKK